MIAQALFPSETELKTTRVTHLAAFSHQLHWLLSPPSLAEVVLAPVGHGEMGRATHGDPRHNKTKRFH